MPSVSQALRVFFHGQVAHGLQRQQGRVGQGALVVGRVAERDHGVITAPNQQRGPGDAFEQRHRIDQPRLL